MILVSRNALACDLVAALTMGLDPEKLKLIAEGIKSHALPLADPKILRNLDLDFMLCRQGFSMAANIANNLPDYFFIAPTG